MLGRFHYNGFPMKTEVVAREEIDRLVGALRAGEPVIFPTETVYGLGAPLFHEEGVKKIFTIKGRPSDNPLIAHISSLEEVRLIGRELSSSFFRLAEAFWPGPLSIVVKKEERVPSLVSGGHSTIAIRMPAHPIAKELIERLGEPIVAPSANLSGRPSPTSLFDALEDLEGRVSYAMDGGQCQLGLESTVIHLLGDRPTLLRPGTITREALEEVLGESVVFPPKGGPALSPGMKYRHYAPNAQVKLIYKREEIGGPSFFKPTPQTLYSILRAADRENRSLIELYCDEEVQGDMALMNRLLRASGQIGG